jgi:hypothetical protein
MNHRGRRTKAFWLGDKDLLFASQWAEMPQTEADMTKNGHGASVGKGCFLMKLNSRYLNDNNSHNLNGSAGVICDKNRSISNFCPVHWHYYR